LGITYKEMGLTEDALNEFSIAHKGAAGQPKELDCLSMIGLLQTMQGDFTKAIDTFSRALESEFCTSETEKALRYDLACACEAAGQAQRALSEYLLVQNLDADFREVASNIQKLTAAEEAVKSTGNPQNNPARKSGYL